MIPALIEVFPPAALQIGPVALPLYGLGYAVALAVTAWLTPALAARRGLDRKVFGDGVLVVVLFGIIGARLYHVIDEWEVYQNDLLRIVLPPYSGLGVFGGIGAGIIGVWVFTRIRHQPFFRWADVIAPSVFLGQAIARWGNFFNQELYGPPTDLPWGITIDCAHRVLPTGILYPCPEQAAAGTVSYPPLTTGFHPLFFYESALNVLGAIVALLLARKLAHRLRDGDLVALWFIWYGAVRTVLETLRSGWNWTAGGIAVAQMFGIAAILVGVVILLTRSRRRRWTEPTGAEVTAGAPPRDDALAPGSATT